MTRAFDRCVCSHPRCCHEHYRPGTDCSAMYVQHHRVPARCGCIEFRRRPLLARIVQALSGGKETSPA